MITSAEAYELNSFLGATNVPGYDNAQGNPLPSSALLAGNSISQYWGAGICYTPSTNTIIIRQAGAVLNGYNLSGMNVVVDANNVTISNCTFDDTVGWITVEQSSGYSGLTVQNCTFNGGDNVQLADFISSIDGYITIANNVFLDTPMHTVGITSGVIENNAFLGGGYQAGAHVDAINIYNTTGSVLVTGNFVDWTNNANALIDTNNAIRVTNAAGATGNLTVTNNILLGGAYTVAVENVNSDPTATFSNVVISNNYIGDYQYGAYYPGVPAGVAMGAYTDVGFDNAALATAAWSAYLASGIVTNNLVVATVGETGIAAAKTGTTTLYGNGVAGLHMWGGSSETIFVGGAGTDYMWGGSGKNIYSFLAVADSTPQSSDSIGNFNVASDVIDLSAFNAEPGSAAPVNFNFIGSAPFSAAGGEVCVVQDVADDLTLVEADLVGDSSADFELAICGLFNLTAANFALTAAQYQVDIAFNVTVATVALFETSQSTLDQAAGGFSILDSAVNIQADLAGLQADAGHIIAVNLTGGAVAVNAATFSADQAILNKVVGGFEVVGVATATFLAEETLLNTVAGGLGIADIAANIFSQLAALEADASHIDTVTLSSGVLSVNVSTFNADESVLNNVVGGFDIVDTAANVLARIGALEADASQIDAVTLSSGVLSVNAATLNANQAILNIVAGGFSVVDTGSNIQAQIGTLGADASEVQALTLTSGAVAVSAATFSADEAVLNKIAGGFSIVDTAANIQAQIGALEADASNVNAVTSQNGFVSVNIAALTVDQAILGKIVGGYAVVGVSTATFLSEENVLNAVAGGLGIADVAANIQAQLRTIEADVGHIDSETVTSGAVSVNAANFLQDEGVLNKIVGGFDIVDTFASVLANLGALEADVGNIDLVTLSVGALSVNAATFNADEAVLVKIASGFSVADTAANVLAQLGALETAAGQINAVTLSSGAVSVNVATFLADEAALNKVVGGFAVADTAANVLAQIGALGADAAAIDAVTLSGGALSVNAATFAADETVLNKVAGGFAVVDTAANVLAQIGALGADAGQIDSVTLSGGAMSVNAATFAANAALLSKVAGGFAVVDVGANIQAQIAGLEKYAGSITSLTLSDTTAASPDVLTLTQANAKADAAILAEIVQPYVLDSTNGGTTTVTGYGAGLTIGVAAGSNAAITGGGAGDTFNFSANFGTATIVDFASYANSPTPDAISLSTTDFANWATLLSDAHSSGGAANTTFIAADGASLTVDGINPAGFKAASAALQAEFKFHA